MQLGVEGACSREVPVSLGLLAAWSLSTLRYRRIWPWFASWKILSFCLFPVDPRKVIIAITVEHVSIGSGRTDARGFSATTLDWGWTWARARNRVLSLTLDQLHLLNFSTNIKTAVSRISRLVFFISISCFLLHVLANLTHVLYVIADHAIAGDRYFEYGVLWCSFCRNGFSFILKLYQQKLLRYRMYVCSRFFQC